MLGYNDMMEFKKVNDVCVMNGFLMLIMEEGYVYYINVRVSIVDSYLKYIRFSIFISVMLYKLKLFCLQVYNKVGFFIIVMLWVFIVEVLFLVVGYVFNGDKL